MPVTNKNLQIRKFYNTGKKGLQYKYDPISKTSVQSGCCIESDIIIFNLENTDFSIPGTFKIQLNLSFSPRSILKIKLINGINVGQATLFSIADTITNLSLTTIQSITPSIPTYTENYDSGTNTFYISNIIVTPQPLGLSQNTIISISLPSVISLLTGVILLTNQ